MDNRIVSQPSIGEADGELQVLGSIPPAEPINVFPIHSDSYPHEFAIGDNAHPALGDGVHAAEIADPHVESEVHLHYIGIAHQEAIVDNVLADPIAPNSHAGESMPPFVQGDNENAILLRSGDQAVLPENYPFNPVRSNRDAQQVGIAVPLAEPANAFPPDSGAYSHQEVIVENLLANPSVNSPGISEGESAISGMNREDAILLHPDQYARREAVEERVPLVNLLIPNGNVQGNGAVGVPKRPAIVYPHRQIPHGRREAFPGSAFVDHIEGDQSDQEAIAAIPDDEWGDEFARQPGAQAHRESIARDFYANPLPLDSHVGVVVPGGQPSDAFPWLHFSDVHEEVIEDEGHPDPIYPYDPFPRDGISGFQIEPSDHGDSRRNVWFAH